MMGFKLGGLGKNISVYWLFATCLCVWFLFLHSLPVIAERRMYHDIPLATHLAGYVIRGEVLHPLRVSDDDK